MDSGRFPGYRPKPQFLVYQNPSFSAVLTSNSLQPSKSVFLFVMWLSSVSAVALALITAWGDGFTGWLKQILVSETIAQLIVNAVQTLVGLILTASLTSLIRVFSGKNNKSKLPPCKVTRSKTQGKDIFLTDRQSALLGTKSRQQGQGDGVQAADNSRTSKQVSSASEQLVPLRRSSHSYNPVNQITFCPSPEKKLLSPLSSPYTTPPGSPWSAQSAYRGRSIETEEMLEQFLADVNPGVNAEITPPRTMYGTGITSPPVAFANSATSSRGTRSPPLRPVRMSPGSYPKTGDNGLPLPMSMEQMIDAYQALGIYPQIEMWRGHLRQWFSSVLLNPLVEKIERSHIQVMQAAATIGISITVNPVGSGSQTASLPLGSCPLYGGMEWQPTYKLDEDGSLNQLQQSLVQARDGTVARLPQAGLLGSQTNPIIPMMQTCINTITEHRKLSSLIKGELANELLHQSSFRTDYIVQRIRELAEGTCVRNYGYTTNGEVLGKVYKKWTPQLPSDTHLLAYLFCAFLVHPKLKLHADHTPHSIYHTITNPILVGCLPPKERFPEKYVAILSEAPSYIHPGALILVIGKHGPPVFTLYWDKKIQFSLQGRTALWDAVLLLCHRIKVAFDGVVQGSHLGSSALNILSVFESD